VIKLKYDTKNMIEVEGQPPIRSVIFRCGRGPRYKALMIFGQEQKQENDTGKHRRVIYALALNQPSRVRIGLASSTQGRGRNETGGMLLESRVA